MRWSKLKQRIESGFAPEVAGRIQLHTTRYHKAHDQMGRSWITVDGVEIINMEHLSGEPESLQHRVQQGKFAGYDLPRAMRAYLNLSIDEALNSENSLIRALAMIDRRFGKRRLRSVDPTLEPSPVSELAAFRQHILRPIKPTKPN